MIPTHYGLGTRIPPRGTPPVGPSVPTGPLNQGPVAPSTAPAGPSGTPAYEDYFKYANAGPDTGSAWLAGTPGYTGWEGGTNIGDGQVEGQTWKGFNYVEPSNVPDKYKGLLKYNELGTPTGGPSGKSGFQMNKDVIAKLPKTKFGTVDNVTSLGKDGKGTGGQAMHLANPNLKYYDDNYGWITPKENIIEDRHFNDTFADTIMPMIASAAFGNVGGLGGAGMGAWTGGASSAVGAAKNYGEGGSKLY